MEQPEGGLFSHDPAIFYDQRNDMYYTYSTDTAPISKDQVGGQIRRSKDLIHFEYIGCALLNGEIPKEVKEHTHASGIWAPDIVLINKEYRLYYSASTPGSQYSVIGLAVSDNPEGPFIPRGIVVKTTPDSPVNAIDANIVTEEETGEQYLVYGSFWGGIRILKLDKATGFPVEEGFGISIARRNRSADGSIEGAYIRYNKETGYYYLFASYDSLSNLYHVRVGRSRNITGPYLDYHGIQMTNTELPANHVGFKITTGYSFKQGTGFLALGHNSVLNREDEWFMVCHARYEKNPFLHCLNIRKMFFTETGWPVVSPCLYSGERKKPFAMEEVAGEYLRIDFVQDANELCEKPTKMVLSMDGSVVLGGVEYEMKEQKKAFYGVKGEWKYIPQIEQLYISYHGTEEQYFVLPSEDREEGGRTIAITGMNADGNCIWGKKM